MWCSEWPWQRMAVAPARHSAEDPGAEARRSSSRQTLSKMQRHHAIYLPGNQIDPPQLGEANLMPVLDTLELNTLCTSKSAARSARTYWPHQWSCQDAERSNRLSCSKDFSSKASARLRAPTPDGSNESRTNTQMLKKHEKAWKSLVRVTGVFQRISGG